MNAEFEVVRMRVLSILPDDRIGGPHIQSLEIARKLTGQGIDTSFLVPEGGGDFPTKARSDGFTVSTVPFERPHGIRKFRANMRFLLEFVQGVGRIRSVIEEQNTDLIHINGPTNFTAATAAAGSDRSLLWYFNDTLTPTPVREIAATAACRYADSTAVAADAVADYYFSRCQSRPHVLYPPVDVDRFDPRRIGESWPENFLDRGTAPQGPVVGTVANINPAKGLEHFLRAVARIRQTHPDVVAPIVGKRLDSQRRYYRRLESLVADLGLEDTVHFCGYRDDIPAVLGTFDAFVLPSVTEACPVVVLEAMAMEVPVVATDVGGVREQLTDGEHGFVVPAQSPGTIAARVETILEDPERARALGKAARRRVTERFSVESIAGQTESLYREMLAGKG